MNSLFSMKQLMEADPCEDGLDRLTSALGTYSGLTVVTIDNLASLTTSDILLGLQLLPLSDHDQKMIAVKVAVYAAELVAHLTDNPNAARYLNAARAWIDNPCEETRQVATAEATAAAAASDPTTKPKIKSYLIQLIREQS